MEWGLGCTLVPNAPGHTIVAEEATVTTLFFSGMPTGPLAHTTFFPGSGGLSTDTLWFFVPILVFAAVALAGSLLLTYLPF